MAAVSEPGAIVRQGHLRKLKTMKKKYFVLRAETADSSARLEYYESEKKFRSGAAPRRVLPLKSCYNITRRLDLKQKHVIALFTREEQLCIVAENEQDLHAWLAAILKLFRNDDASAELLHPIQHVWQVNVQKKGLGASKNIQGLYNLCLTDKTLTLVKIKSHNNIISDLVIPERVDYSLKNIRRCGDSECFFYMEVGRQTATGAGELWMHSDDSNIAQSMHSTIYHAMMNCAKETENEKDHIVVPGKSSLLLESSNPLPARRQTFSDGRGRAGLYNEKGLCVGACIRQCVCASATHSIDDSAAALAPLAPLPPFPPNAENQPPNNTLTPENQDRPARLIKHHRTVSLPTGCSIFQEPLKIAHGRTRSEPLTGDEVDRAILEKTAMHSSCKAVNGTDAVRKNPWCRRASTGTRFSKLSPAHTKNAATLRNRCETMPSRACSSFESDRTPTSRHADVIDGLASSRDDIDSLSEWYRTPRIPEEPDCCEYMLPRDFMSMRTGGSVAHSRTSSMGVEDGLGVGVVAGTGAGVGAGEREPDGYLPMAPAHVSSSGSVCSGTPSTDPRFSEYQLEPATSHITEERSTRAYSVGSRPPARADRADRAEPARLRAYSAGARRRPALPARHPHGPHGPHAAPHPPHHPHGPHGPHAPRASTDDLMEIDFSANSPQTKIVGQMPAYTPLASSYPETLNPRSNLDEYVDMSPRNAGYVEMKPGEPPAMDPSPASAPAPAPAPDGYVEMSYGRNTRVPTRPIAIAAPRAPPPAPAPAHAGPGPAAPGASPDRRLHGSQTIFPFSPDSPASPPELEHALSTVRETSEEGRPGVASSPQYVTLARPDALNNNKAARRDENRVETVTVCCAEGGTRLHYAALDLEPRTPPAPPPPRLYTQIDFARSETYAADAL